MTDIEIASGCKLQPIELIGAKLGVDDKYLEHYGKYKAKVTMPVSDGKKGKLILVTAINPTPYGEGKTTVSIGLADGLTVTGRKSCIALREPSLGPVFGVKGGATGGGYSQVVPMESINLHFNGDFHAITAANNLLSALIDNHIKQGNDLGIDKVIWRRTLDCNDRALRTVEIALGGEVNGIPRTDGFDITAASEIMAVLCLSDGITDLKRRLGNIIIGYGKDGTEIAASALKAENAMAILLSEALYPNLVQTLIGTPAFIHGGPFANIAHGCNSVAATKTALSLADYVVTEAGFGAELGAEKFFDIKCRAANLEPSAVVLVATARALKYNGGAAKAEVSKPDLEALKRGVCNLTGHLENLKKFGLPVVVAVNKFVTDSEEELNFIKETAAASGCRAIVVEAWAKGGEGCRALADEVVSMCSQNAKHKYLYPSSTTALEKITEIAVNLYGAGSVTLSDTAKEQLKTINGGKYKNYPVCIAKTQYSFSQDATLLGRPRGFEFTVKELIVRGGAEFIVAVCGSIMLMPGLPKVPNAVNMTIDENRVVGGLF